jgi:hypothetical protein
MHKVRIYKEYHSVCPLVGGHTGLRVRGWGSPDSDDWRNSLALCLLCDLMCQEIEGEEREPSQGGQEAGSGGQTASGY